MMVTAVIGLLLVISCRAPDACDSLCVTARTTYERCLEAEGRTWIDSVEFDSESDFDNWCHTWTLERRLLARTGEDASDGTEELLHACEAQQQRLQDDSCDEFFSILLD
ncbi:MAG TPA: hypothetical protein DIU15_00225 [Deltaproteobacteria bacterium]|nr:hypothetical protein [Deltaproteobacteria bacterium]HCP44453.1 hypothetical protein [Deltaproteobacteria bacterium]|tara:strand:+ start:216 stop:542 length:327 start_codon:yes stop_codon:yes gene_type:complete